MTPALSIITRMYFIRDVVRYMIVNNRFKKAKSYDDVIRLVLQKCKKFEHFLCIPRNELKCFIKYAVKKEVSFAPDNSHGDRKISKRYYNWRKRFMKRLLLRRKMKLSRKVAVVENQVQETNTNKLKQKISKRYYNWRKRFMKRLLLWRKMKPNLTSTDEIMPAAKSTDQILLPSENTEENKTESNLTSKDEIMAAAKTTEQIVFPSVNSGKNKTEFTQKKPRNCQSRTQKLTAQDHPKEEEEEEEKVKMILSSRHNSKDRMEEEIVNVMNICNVDRITAEQHLKIYTMENSIRIVLEENSGESKKKKKKQADSKTDNEDNLKLTDNKLVSGIQPRNRQRRTQKLAAQDYHEEEEEKVKMAPSSRQKIKNEMEEQILKVMQFCNVDRLTAKQYLNNYTLENAILVILENNSTNSKSRIKKQAPIYKNGNEDNDKASCNADGGMPAGSSPKVEEAVAAARDYDGMAETEEIKSVLEDMTVKVVKRECLFPSYIPPKEENKKILTYRPLPASDPILILSSDLEKLSPGQWLNDSIVDFYLSYVYHEKIKEEYKAQSHFFSSLFFKSIELHLKETSRISQETIRSRYRNHDIFSKKYLVIPVCERYHWMLIIICHPGGSSSIQDGQEGTFLSTEHEGLAVAAPRCSFAGAHGNAEEKQATVEKTPTLLVFNSIRSMYKETITKVIRRFLQELWAEKTGIDKIFDLECMPTYVLNCPQQYNGTDCGIYILQYIESFFENPFCCSGGQIPDLSNWFDRSVIDEKRQKILNIIGNKQILSSTSVYFPQL